MKMFLFASALALSGVAYAQTAPTMPADAGAATNAPPATPAMPDPSMTPAPAAPNVSAPSATAPDMPATAPTATASATDDSNLPMCSKTVTDKCQQGGKGMMHKKMVHKKK